MLQAAAKNVDYYFDTRFKRFVRFVTVVNP